LIRADAPKIKPFISKLLKIHYFIPIIPQIYGIIEIETKFIIWFNRKSSV
jgi:hypothetical protein